MKTYKTYIFALLLTGIFLLPTSCGQSSKVGSVENNGIESQNVSIRMIHRLAIEQQLRNVFGLTSISANSSLNFLHLNRGIFNNVSNNNISRRNVIYKLYNKACRESDEKDPAILFDNFEAPTVDDIWNKFQPGEKVPEEIIEGANAIQGLDLTTTSQVRMALCLLVSTSLCNTTQNISCLMEEY